MVRPLSKSPLTLVLSGLAMFAFAGNSVLARLALGSESIDAASFSSIRFTSGALTLVLVMVVQRWFQLGTSDSSVNNSENISVGWIPAIVLLFYTITFSAAYQVLEAGAGALLLFGSVQVTMILAALKRGERLDLAEGLGALLALIGLVYLILPNFETPSWLGAVMMLCSGAAWGLYSLLGQTVRRPLAASTENFLRSLPLIWGFNLLSFADVHISFAGVWPAIVAGSITSGLGYVIWYTALRSLSATLAATIQLSIPILAAMGGVLWLQEKLSLHLLISASIVLGGITIALLSRKNQGDRQETLSPES
ncbi:MAG: DMT family transporter [Prochlorotrichaceae cyanobacterium]|jgi:drug/metabolite transporter (DMT)-like permease